MWSGIHLKLCNGDMDHFWSNFHTGRFIFSSLKKKYLQLSKPEKLRQTALAAVQLLDSFTFVETNQTLSFLDFSHRWTSLISRGGLIKTNNNYFLFIRRIEEIVRRTLNVHFIKKYNGEDLRDIIVKQLQESSLLTSNWEVLSRMLPSESLAGQINQKYFTNGLKYVLALMYNALCRF